MHEELVNALRWCADESICCDDFSGEKCPHYSVRGDDCNIDVVLHDAADAIERLQKRNEELQAENATYRKLILLSAGEINKLRYKLHLDEMDIEEIKLP